MAEQDPHREDQILRQLQALRTRVSRLTVVVMLMFLVVLVYGIAEFGQLVNYFAGDPMIWGAIGGLSALVGFVLGWIARRWA